MKTIINSVTKVLLCLLFFLTSGHYATAQKKVYSLGMCVKQALKTSPEIKESLKEIEIYRSKLDEAKAAFFPKIDTTTYIAPMYEIKGNVLDYERNYDKWGPYYHIAAQLTMPIYTFGKVQHYKDAARNGVLYAKNKTLQKQAEIILDIKKYYYGYILANRLKKLITEVKTTLNEAIEKADKLYQSGTGEVKKGDLEKLKIYMAEVKINTERVNKLIKLARLALFLKMGIKESENIDIKIIPLKPLEITLKPLEFYLSNALKNRPEIKQIQAGLQAKKSLIAAEKSSFYPIFFVGGELKYNWSSVVDDQHSPWLDDPYNGIDGGVAIGLKYYFDYKTIRAKIKAARADYEKLLAQSKFAESGIALQIKQAYMEFLEAKKNIEFTKEELKAANRWVRSAGLLYAMGTGEAKDALEGLAAYALAQQKYYTAIYDFNMKAAELFKAAGMAEVIKND